MGWASAFVVLGLNAGILVLIVSGVVLAGPLAFPLGLCSSAEPVAVHNQPSFRGHIARLSFEEVQISKHNPCEGFLAITRQVGAPVLRAAACLLAPLCCTAGSSLHVLWATVVAGTAAVSWVASLVAFSFLSVFGHIAEQALRALPLVMSGCAFAIMLPFTVMVDVACILCGAATCSAWAKLCSVRAWCLCVATACEGLAELSLVFTSHRLDLCVMQASVYLSIVTSATCAVLQAVEVWWWCATVYVEAAYFDKSTACSKRLSRCEKRCASIQARVLAAWQYTCCRVTSLPFSPTKVPGEQSCWGKAVVDRWETGRSMTLQAGFNWRSSLRPAPQHARNWRQACTAALAASASAQWAEWDCWHTSHLPLLLHQSTGMRYQTGQRGCRHPHGFVLLLLLLVVSLACIPLAKAVDPTSAGTALNTGSGHVEPLRIA